MVPKRMVLKFRHDARFAPRSSSPTDSFTLLEMLVAFTIILVLAGLLIPALKAVKEGAQQAVCVSNMQQISLAITMYGQDKGRYPLAYESDRNFSHRIEVYLSGRRNFDETSNNLRSAVIQCPARTFKPANNIVLCYGLHCRVVGDLILDGFFDPPDPGVFPRAYPFTQRPSEVILMADTDQRSNVNGGEAFASLWNPLDYLFDYSAATAGSPPSWGTGDNTDSTSFFSYGQIRFRHKFNQRANCMMVDGHMESLHEDDIRRKHVRINDD